MDIALYKEIRHLLRDLMDKNEHGCPVELLPSKEHPEKQTYDFPEHKWIPNLQKQ